MPDEPEVHGLLALMQIHHARRKARFSGDELVLLEDQDRSLWDAEEIAAGRTALERAIALRGRGPYVLQAAIASLQAEERIDWNEVAALYGQLAQITALAGGRAEPRGRSRPGRVNRAGARDRRAARRSTTTSTCTRRAASCCAGSAGTDEAREAFERALALARSARERRFLAATDRRAVDRLGNSRPTHRGCPLGARPFVVSA